MAANSSKYRPVSKSLKEYGRGIIGGLLFSLPLLYTMEVWWEGYKATPLSLIAYVLVIFLLLLGYNRFAGMREDASFKEVIIDSIEEMGLGILISFCILWMLNRVSFDMHHLEITSMVIIEGMSVAIGLSVGTAQLGGNGKEDDKGTKKDKKQSENGESKKVVELQHIILSACGAILIGSNVGATMEIVVLGLEMKPWHILTLALLSVSISVLVLFFVNFKGGHTLSEKNMAFDVVWGAVSSFAIGLIAAVFILWFFGRFENTAFSACIEQTIILGFATTLGASAGRLLIKGE